MMITTTRYQIEIRTTHNLTHVFVTKPQTQIYLTITHNDDDEDYYYDGLNYRENR